jgi:hypothetical protein
MDKDPESSNWNMIHLPLEFYWFTQIINTPVSSMAIEKIPLGLGIVSHIDDLFVLGTPIASH